MWVLLGVDTLALVLAVTGAGVARLVLDNVLPVATLGWPERHVAASALVVPVLLALLWMRGRYSADSSLSGPREYAEIAHAVSYGVLLALGLSYFAGGEPLVSRSWLLMVWALCIFGLALGRFLVRYVVRWSRRHGALHTRVVIVGASSFGIALAEQFRAADGEGIDVVGFLDEYVPVGQELLPGVAVMGRPTDLGKYSRADVADEYVLVPQALPHERLEEITRLMVACDGPTLRIAVNSTGLLTHGVLVTQRSQVPLVTVQRARLAGLDRVLKRAADIVVSILALLVTGPVVVVALARAYLAGKRVLFESHRVHITGGGHTRIWLLDRSVSGWLPVRGAPSLVPVLVGRLSLIGPRPIPSEEASADLPGLWATAVKPGLMGPWRLSGPHASLEDQAIEDLTYVRNYSVWEDLRIAGQSIRRLLKPNTDTQLGRWQDRPRTNRQRDWWARLESAVLEGDKGVSVPADDYQPA
jgi:lipopolysaccharide/colanic/teichoic acid biosynthesis glycosyltransferase